MHTPTIKYVDWNKSMSYGPDFPADEERHIWLTAATKVWLRRAHKAGRVHEQARALADEAFLADCRRRTPATRQVYQRLKRAQGKAWREYQRCCMYCVSVRDAAEAQVGDLRAQDAGKMPALPGEGGGE